MSIENNNILKYDHENILEKIETSFKEKNKKISDFTLHIKEYLNLLTFYQKNNEKNDLKIKTLINKVENIKEVVQNNNKLNPDMIFYQTLLMFYLKYYNNSILFEKIQD